MATQVTIQRPAHNRLDIGELGIDPVGREAQIQSRNRLWLEHHRQVNAADLRVSDVVGLIQAADQQQLRGALPINVVDSPFQVEPTLLRGALAANFIANQFVRLLYELAATFNQQQAMCAAAILFVVEYTGTKSLGDIEVVVRLIARHPGEVEPEARGLETLGARNHPPPPRCRHQSPLQTGEHPRTA